MQRVAASCIMGGMKDSSNNTGWGKGRILIAMAVCVAFVVAFYLLFPQGEQQHKAVNSVSDPTPPIPNNVWLKAAYDSSRELSNGLLQDEIYERLVPLSLSAGESAFAEFLLEQIENEPRKASALVETAVFERQNNRIEGCEKYMDAALKLAKAVHQDEECGDYVYIAIARTLMQQGYIQDALSIYTRYCQDSDCWDEWEELMRESVTEQAKRGNVAKAKLVAAGIPWEIEQVKAYIDIANIQYRDGQVEDAILTLQELYDLFESSLRTQAYSYSLISASMAEMGDAAKAKEVRALCERSLSSRDGKMKQDSINLDDSAKASAVLARTCWHLGQTEDAKLWLKQAKRLAEKQDNPDLRAEVYGDIAETLMSINDLDAALAVLEGTGTSGWLTVFPRIVTHPQFPIDSDVIDGVMTSIEDDFDRDFAGLFVLGAYLRHGYVRQAEVIAHDIQDKHFQQEAYMYILEKLCDLGNSKQAVELATDKIDDLWTEFYAYVLLGETLAKTLSSDDLQTFLRTQTSPVRHSATCIGIVQTLVNKTTQRRTEQDD